MKYLLAALLALFLVPEVQAKMVTQTVTYQQDGTTLKSFLIYDDAIQGKRPGVLVVPEWYGLNDFAKQKAQELATLGYVALAVDMYGDGRSTTNREEAAKWSGEVKGNPPLLRSRAQAALKTLAASPQVAPGKLAAIGFCFGGTTVLELAYSGADLSGVVSFHGGLPKAGAGDLKQIKAAVMVLHGADDPHVSAADISAFMEAMRQAHADWQMVFFGGAVHSFTNPAAGNNKAAGIAYNEPAAHRSWRYMQDFFQEIFGGGKGK